jgi:arylsulfatase A-like enzyme
MSSSTRQRAQPRQEAHLVRSKKLQLALGALALVALVAGAVTLVSQRHSAARRAVFPAELTPGAAAGFNVLLVTLDTIRADRLGCYGWKRSETPVLDGLAERGLLFADAVTVAPLTLPSHATLLTGLYPPNHGVRKNGEYRLASEHVTLAELLKDRGYDTGAFVSAFVLDARFGLGQGFDTYDDGVALSESSPLADTFEERPARSVTDAALAWLRDRGGDRPFLAWVHYFDPHAPRIAPEPYSTQLDDPYDAEIAYVDFELGRLLEELERKDLVDQTLVVVVGDHGEDLGEHGEPTHGFFMYGSVMRIPLILSCPGLFRGPRVFEEDVVSIVDLVPTLLELLGVEPGPNLDGSSLLDAVARHGRTVYMENMAPYLDHGWAPLFGLRRHRDKYIRAPTPEYYDLWRDPGEQTNLHVGPPVDRKDSRDQLAAELERMLSAWAPPEEVAAAVQPPDAAARARLQALGYLGGPGPAAGDVALDPKRMLQLYLEINAAKTLAGAGEFDHAIAILREVLVAAPRNRAALGEIARLYATKGRMPQAERAIRRYIAVKPSAHALTLLAQILIARGHLDEVDRIATEAHDLDPAHGLSFIVWGDLAVREGRFGEARAHYLRAAEVDPYRFRPAAEERLASLQRHLRQ